MFNGQHLGEHKFSDIVRWCSPVPTLSSQRLIPELNAIVQWKGEFHFVILKKNTTKKRTLCFVDQLKELLGLKKLGTNTIYLDGVPRKKNKDGPWLCSREGPQYDANGFLVIPPSIQSLKDYFHTDANLYIHRQKTFYYVIRAHTYRIPLIHSWPSVSSSSSSDIKTNSNTNSDRDMSIQSSSLDQNSSLEQVSDQNSSQEISPSSATFSSPEEKRTEIVWEEREDDITYFYPTHPYAHYRIEQTREVQWEIQKIMVFRKLLNLPWNFKKDMFLLPSTDVVTKESCMQIVSCNEFRFCTEGQKKTVTKEEKFFFPEPTMYYRFLARMLNLNENYTEQLIEFQEKLYHIARTEFPEETYQCNLILERLQNAMSLYINNMRPQISQSNFIIPTMPSLHA